MTTKEKVKYMMDTHLVKESPDNTGLIPSKRWYLTDGRKQGINPLRTILNRTFSEDTLKLIQQTKEVDVDFFREHDIGVIEAYNQFYGEENGEQQLAKELKESKGVGKGLQGDGNKSPRSIHISQKQWESYLAKGGERNYVFSCEARPDILIIDFDYKLTDDQFQKIKKAFKKYLWVIEKNMVKGSSHIYIQTDNKELRIDKVKANLKEDKDDEKPLDIDIFLNSQKNVSCTTPCRTYRILYDEKPTSSISVRKALTMLSKTLDYHLDKKALQDMLEPKEKKTISATTRTVTGEKKNINLTERETAIITHGQDIMRAVAGQGKREDLYMSLSAGLLEHGFNADKTTHIITEIYEETEEDKQNNRRLDTLNNTIRRYNNGELTYHYGNFVTFIKELTNDKKTVYHLNQLSEAINHHGYLDQPLPAGLEEQATNIPEEQIQNYEPTIETFLDEFVKPKYLETAQEIGYYELDVSLLDMVFNEVIDSEGLHPVIERISEELLKSVSDNKYMKPPEIRLINVPERYHTSINDIGADNVGELLITEGRIIAMDQPQTRITTAMFECRSCYLLHEEKMADSNIVQPSLCGECGGRSFRLIEEKSKLIDTRNFILEENTSEKTQPARIKVNIEGLLTKEIDLNQEVTIIGTSSRDNIPITKGQTNKETIIKANNILHKSKANIELKHSDIEENLELSVKQDILDTLAKSVAPSIELPIEMKKALLCYLVKGEQIGSIKRKEIHVLIIGDPGTAKSKISRDVINLTTKSTYADGTASSGVGLTASVVKEPLLNTNVVELGAFPKANGGHCCIDEFDKLPNEQANDLLNAMETGLMNINKSGVHTEIETKVSLLALANPKFGRYDRYKTISEQITFPQPLLSRFDLIFLHEDRPNVELDTLIAEKIVTSEDEQTSNDHLINEEQLQKYLEQARHVHVKLSDNAKKYAKEWYVKLRNGNHEDQDVPIPADARTYESLIRIASAFTKLKLKDTIEAEEIIEAEELLNYQMQQIGIDPITHKPDIAKVRGYANFEDNQMRNTILEVIQEATAEKLNGIRQAELIQLLDEKGISRRKYYEYIQQLEIHKDISIFEQGRDKIIQLNMDN